MCEDELKGATEMLQGIFPDQMSQFLPKQVISSFDVSLPDDNFTYLFML